MPVFDTFTAIGAALAIVWNVLIFILKGTLIAGLVMLVIDPDSWLTKFLLSILSVVTKVVCDFIIKIQMIILKNIFDAIIDLIKLFPSIVVSDVVKQISNSFTAIALTLITAFFIYQAVKNTFSYLGFDGEPTLNTIIVYMVVICVLMFSNGIISTLLQITYDISMIFITSITDFGGALSNGFGNLTSTSFDNPVVAIGTNCLIVIILGKIITSTMDLGFTIVMKMVSISIMIMIGPFAVSFGVLKSMRLVMITWLKSIFVTNVVFMMYSIMLFFVSNSATSILGKIDEVSKSDYRNVIKLFVLAGLIMAIAQVEGIIVAIFSQMGPSAGGSGSLGIAAPTPADAAGYMSNPGGHITAARESAKNISDKLAARSQRKNLMKGIDHLPKGPYKPR